jgi:dipeptidyl aminopeptidase/acylaminoacyl peptidase
MTDALKLVATMILTLLTVSSSTRSLLAQTTASQNPMVQIVGREPVQLPAFESNKEIARYADRAEYDDAKADPAFTYERVLYKSADAVVSGYLYSPRKAQREKLPVIVFSRGNYVVNNQAPVLLTMVRRLAREGFILFAPMFRGSDGTGGHDEMGGADLHDLRSAIELVKSLDQADATNVFLYGESRGAMMTYFALRDDAPVQAAAVYGGVTDIKGYLNKIDPEGRFAATVWPEYATHKEDILHSRSAIEWPERIRKPLLIMHGGADQSVSPLHSLRMAEMLTTLGREYSLQVFANDNHILTRHRAERDKRTTDWFRAHMAKANSPNPALTPQ